MEIKVNLEQTILCGQMFRYKRDGDEFLIFSGDKTARCTQNSEKAVIKTSDEDYFYTYFDQNTDYNKIHKELSCDKTLKELCEKYRGLRILNQDLWEMTESFIVSQNNNIPRIQAILERLCEAYGKKGEEGYAFPEPQVLSSLEREELAFLRAGYRDNYIIDAAKKFDERKINTDIVLNGDLKEAREELYKIKGVGPKVADCILLFGASRRDAFPVDTWMKKALKKVYGIEFQSADAFREFAKQRFGEYAGYAQQYLFFGARNGDLL